MSASAAAVAGVGPAGFMTTVLPNARAGADFHAGIAMGKFHGVINPNTPTASRAVVTSTPGRVDARFWPWRRSASPAKYLKIRPARPTSPMPSGSVLPSSRDNKRPSSSRRLKTRSPALSRQSERTSGEASDHAGKALRAAATAASTSLCPPSGKRATMSRVSDGFSLSCTSGALTRSPPMKCVSERVESLPVTRVAS